MVLLLRNAMQYKGVTQQKLNNSHHALPKKNFEACRPDLSNSGRLPGNFNGKIGKMLTVERCMRGIDKHTNL